MDAWLVWLIAGVVAAVGEMVIMGFFLAPFAAGALIAALAAVIGVGSTVQWILFAAVTATTLGVVRPIARRHLHQPAQLRTGTAALVGRTAIVLERIDNDAAAGKVRLDGEVWSARAYDEDETIEAGTRVQVIQIRGATALVSQ